MTADIASSVPRSAWIDVAGRGTHYLTAGFTGSPIVLLHGGGLDAAALTYRYTIPALAASHRVFAPDWPGFGESASAPDSWDIADYVTFLGQFLDSLGLRRASLVGLSFGGGIALGFALQAPERVDKLVLVDSYGLGREIPGGLAGYLAVHLPFVNDVSWSLLRRSRSLVRQSLFAIVRRREAITDELVDEVFRLVQKPGMGAAWRNLQQREVRWGGLRTCYLDRLPHLAVPTLLVHGAEDPAVPLAWTERAARLIPGSQAVVLPHCGHWTPRECPAEFNRVVADFLLEHPETNEYGN